jgi:hypothetical protein
MHYAPAAHVLSGPLDALIELGIPLLIFLALYWWSSRKPKPKADASAPVVSKEPPK